MYQASFLLKEVCYNVLKGKPGLLMKLKRKRKKHRRPLAMAIVMDYNPEEKRTRCGAKNNT